MATFGDALAALDDFRADLAHELQSAAVPEAQAMAFRATAGTDSPFADVHATGVGVRGDESGDFVIKVFVFPGVASAQAVPPLLSREYQGVGVETEQLPVQTAYGARAARRPRPSPSATTPADHQKPVNPVPGGVEIAPLGGNFVGTLGCYVRRGPDESGPLFVLSNNHVLADTNRFPVGHRFTQPFTSPADPQRVLAALSEFEPILFPTAATQPRNVMDAAIGSVVGPLRPATGKMLGIPNYTPRLLAARPGMAVTKAGRTTGVTRGTIRAVRVRGVQVNFGTRQNPVIATFDNVIQIRGAGGGPFSNPGDSGSVILDRESGRPVALLFAGDGVSTTACDLTAVCNRFGVRPV